MLRRKLVLFSLGEMFCRYLLGPIFLFSFCLDDVSIGESVVLKSPTINVQGSICDLNCSVVSFTKAYTFVFGAFL